MTNQQPIQAPLKFLAISGSLRSASSNTTVLRAAIALAPVNIQITLYERLADIPPFNPDLDGETAPPAVTEFRALLQKADAVLICSPEYAHGVPGVLKNALDWIVGSGEFMDKPVALLNASRGSTYAHVSLTETLSVMMAKVNAEASIRLPLTSNKIDEASIFASPEISGALREAINVLARAIS